MDRAGEKERITLLSRNPIKTEKRTPQAKKRLWSFFYYDNISFVQKQLSLWNGQRGCYAETGWKEKILCSKATVQEAAEKTGISRSSFYKYKDDIFPFHEETRGKTITFIIQMDDEPGLLSMVLQTIARFHGNILTIHQSIPISGIATLTLSVQILQGEGDAEAMVDDIEQMEGIHYLKILGRE